MAKTKAELLAEARQLGIEVNESMKVAEIQALLTDLAAKEIETATPAELTDETTEEPSVAKAGKRSAKAQREIEEKQAKEERKASGEAAEDKPKVAVKPARSRLERRGKKFRKGAELIEKGKLYSLDDAVDLAKKTNAAKFDATVELHVNLGVDPRHADQNIRDNVLLPAGSGKTVKIAVLTDDAEAAKKAGADIAGTDDLLAQLEKNELNFDILIATPSLMPRLGKYARVLGPRGLMPNPKSGTVTTEIDRAVSEAKAGRVEYRVDTTGIVHIGVGKASFENTRLVENLQAVLSSIKAHKPSSVKGNYIQAIHLTTTMGPSVKVDLTSIG